jgi:hypothetical protein
MLDLVWQCDVQEGIKCVIAVGATAAVATVASAEIQSSAASSAANTQANALNKASAAQQAEQGTIVQSLAPYNNIGQNAATQLGQLTGANPNTGVAPTAGAGQLGYSSLTAPFQPTMAQLANTPGYQFTLNQGLQNTENAYTNEGLGRSGAALKGSANYAEGLAATTYQQQFTNYLGQNQQIYNMLNNQVATGENAAAETGVLGTQNTTAANTLAANAGGASAAGQIGSANATAGGLSGVGSSIGQTLLLSGLLQNSSGLTNPTGVSGQSVGYGNSYNFEGA